MSTLKADTLVASDGTSPVTLTKQSAAKYRIHFDMQDNGITDSLNSSSITDNNPGQYDLNFTNNTSAIEYAFSAYSNGYSLNTSFSAQAGGFGVSWSDNTKITNTDGIGFTSYSSGGVDGKVNVAVVFGDLA